MNLATATNVVFHYFLYFSSPFAILQKDYFYGRLWDVGGSVCVTRQCQNNRGQVLIGVFPIIAGRKMGGRRGGGMIYYDGSSSFCDKHKLNMEVDLQSLFGLHVT
jgi:hypothetical protein